MNWKLTKDRLILTIILFLVLISIVEVFSRGVRHVYDTPQNYGFPFTYQMSGELYVASSGPNVVNEFYWAGLVGDVIAWLMVSYVLSVFIVRKKRVGKSSG